MNKKKVTSIHKSRSEKKGMPSAVDDAADVMSKYDKINIKKSDEKYNFEEINYEKPPHH
jgi:hypothetical protein|tara:strand:+ start:1189 stop:1365 length:177 start_codon:yes stop_codon:yes gene_type:complete